MVRGAGRRLAVVPSSGFFGACFAIPGDLASRTGGYAYARAVLAEMPLEGWQLDHLELPASFPQPDAAALAATSRAFKGVPGDRLLFVDGLAFGSFPDWLLAEQQGRWVALVHHPLALETGLSPERAAALKASEARALACCEAVVAASPETARELIRSYGVPEGKLVVAQPGTELPDAAAEGGGERPCLLTVGTISPRKGQDVLVKALAQVTDLSWRCRLIGSDRREPEAVALLRDLIIELGLSERVEIAGEVAPEALAPAYREADIFVLPSYYEGYGMAFAEAMAYGLPIVACPTGAVCETVPAEAALFVPPGAPNALAAAVRRLLGDKALRSDKAAAAWRHGRTLPTWHDTASKIVRAFERVSAR